VGLIVGVVIGAVVVNINPNAVTRDATTKCDDW